LNFRVICRDLINQAAIRAGAPEVALATIDDLGLLGLHPSTLARQNYHIAVREMMEEYSKEGNIVIIGRAGQVILKDHPNVLHVKVIAPSTLRAKRIAQAQNISLEAAQSQVEMSDKNRRNYLKRYYKVRWDNPELYDLIVNTARLNPSQAACLICQTLDQCLLG
ncbi:MAG: cytidylate kinase-like family protein, partial [Anaerolineales bacterium]|nr:cytidylate kinase-like family protein [Anaerolineales bacterium]